MLGLIDAGINRDDSCNYGPGPLSAAGLFAQQVRAGTGGIATEKCEYTLVVVAAIRLKGGAATLKSTS